jgi:hypothetical protein
MFATVILCCGKSCEVDTQCKMKSFEIKFWYLHPIVFVNQATIHSIVIYYMFRPKHVVDEN